jgi:hypothetical protein
MEAVIGDGTPSYIDTELGLELSHFFSVIY